MKMFSHSIGTRMAIALGLGALAALFTWPLMALFCPRCRSRAA